MRALSTAPFLFPFFLLYLRPVPSHFICYQWGSKIKISHVEKIGPNFNFTCLRTLATVAEGTQDTAQSDDSHKPFVVDFYVQETVYTLWAIKNETLLFFR